MTIVIDITSGWAVTFIILGDNMTDDDDLNKKRSKETQREENPFNKKQKISEVPFINKEIDDNDNNSNNSNDSNSNNSNADNSDESSSETDSNVFDSISTNSTD